MQGVSRGPQGCEGQVPGIGQHDKPGHTGNQEVVDNDENNSTRYTLTGPSENKHYIFVNLIQSNFFTENVTHFFFK